jgi:VanZ family protein
VKPIKRLLAPNKYAIWSAVLWTMFILIMCFKTPSIEKKLYFTNVDKIVHFTFYFVFVNLWFRYLFYKNLQSLKTKAYLAIIAIILGVLIEMGQSIFTTSRQGDIWDIMANSSGALLGIYITGILYRSK